LAGIAQSCGDNQRAEELYQQALAIGEQTLEPEHPDVALFLNNLAFLANKQGQYQKAEPLYQRARRACPQRISFTCTSDNVISFISAALIDTRSNLRTRPLSTDHTPYSHG